MNHDEIFERLEPPAGGLATLRTRLEARSNPARRLALPAFALAVAMLALFLSKQGAPLDPLAVARSSGGPAEVSLGFAAMPSAVVTIEEASRATTALAEVPTSNPNVAFYWVSSTTWRE
jgi:hypothetical protein